MSRSPWLSIWTSPRSTIGEIVEDNPRKGMFFLATLYGFFYILNLSPLLVQSLNLEQPYLLLFSLIFSPLVGYVLFYIVAVLFYLSGKLINGQAPFSHVLSSVAWSALPSILYLFLGAIYSVMTLNNLDFFQSKLSGLVILLSVVANIWYLVLVVNCLKQVQGFSILKAILNVFLPFVVLTVLYLILVIYSGLTAH